MGEQVSLRDRGAERQKIKEDDEESGLEEWERRGFQMKSLEHVRETMS